MNASRRSLLRFAIRMLISLLLLGLVATVVPFDSLLAAFGHAVPWMLGLSCLSVPLVVYIDANRTRVLTRVQGMTHGVLDLCRISLVVSFYSLLLPGIAAGGVLRWHQLSKLDTKPAEALAVIVLGRALSTVTTVAVGFVCWSLDAEARAHTIWGVMLGVLLLSLVGFLWLVFFSKYPESLAPWLERRRGLPRIVRAWANKVLWSAANFQRLDARRLLATLGLLLLNDLVVLASFYLLALALHLSLPLTAVGWTRAFVLLLTLLPVSILGIGAREGGLIAMLGIYHIDAASAVAYSTLILGRHVIAGLLGGCLVALGAGWNKDTASHAKRERGRIELKTPA